MICEMCGEIVLGVVHLCDGRVSHPSQEACVERLKELLASSREDAETWQKTLEEIIEMTGVEGPSSIASLAVEGVRKLQASLLNKRGDDLCWIVDHDAMRTRPLPRAEMLESCRRYLDQLHSDHEALDVGQMTIAQLEKRVLELQEQLRMARRGSEGEES